VPRHSLDGRLRALPEGNERAQRSSSLLGRSENSLEKVYCIICVLVDQSYIRIHLNVVVVIKREVIVENDVTGYSMRRHVRIDFLASYRQVGIEIVTIDERGL